MFELLPNGNIRSPVPMRDPRHPQFYAIARFKEISPDDPEYEKCIPFLFSPDDVAKARQILADYRARVATSDTK